MKQFCMKIDLISQGRENVLFLPSNMVAMTSHENALYNFLSLCQLYFKRKRTKHKNTIKIMYDMKMAAKDY